MSEERYSWHLSNGEWWLTSMPEKKRDERLASTSNEDGELSKGKLPPGETAIQPQSWVQAYRAEMAAALLSRLENFRVIEREPGWIEVTNLSPVGSKEKSMIKLDGKLLFEQWCKCRGIAKPCLFCELPNEEVLAWKFLADWLCRHEWESVDFAWQKVLKEEAKDFTSRMERVEQAEAKESIIAGWRKVSFNTTEDYAVIGGETATHHKSCALRHGGIACTC